MAIGAGLAGQIGLATQGVDYDTAATVTRFLEFDNENIVTDVAKLYGRGIGVGRFQRADRVKTYIRQASGQVLLPVMNKGFGLVFEHMLGQNTITGATADKTHTAIPSAAALAGKFATWQVGRPDLAGTVQPFTFIGGKVRAWEFQFRVDEILQLMLDLDFKTVGVGTALASASYAATQEFFAFHEGALSIDGSTFYVKSGTLRGENGLAHDRRFLGNLKREPLAAGELIVSGQLEAEFENRDVYDAWVAGTVPGQLVLSFTTATLIPTTAVPFSLTITLDDIEYNGDTPNVDDEGILQQAIPFKALYDGTNPLVQVVYVTNDTAS